MRLPEIAVLNQSFACGSIKASDGGTGVRMEWLYLIGLALVLWGACGGVMTIGRRLWPLDTALRVHLVAAPVIAFLVSAAHAMLAPEFSPALRATTFTGLVAVLDAIVVAPLFERSYAMFRSIIGTWLPFVAIFLASSVAGYVVRA